MNVGEDDHDYGTSQTKYYPWLSKKRRLIGSPLRADPVLKDDDSTSAVLCNVLKDFVLASRCRGRRAKGCEAEEKDGKCINILFTN